MGKFFIILSMLSLHFNAHATWQLQNKFSYKGKIYRTNLDRYIFAQCYMGTYFKQFPEKHPSSGVISTNLYRGYVATYEIKDSFLVLKDIEIPSSLKPHELISVKDKVITNGKDLVIDWYTGVIVLNYGDELIDGVIPDCRALYNETDIEYILLQVENGRVTHVREFAVNQYNKFKKRQLEAFKTTDEYKRLVNKMLNKNTKPAHIDAAINNFLMYYTRKFLVYENN